MPLPGSSAASSCKMIGGQTHDLAASSIRTRSNLGQTLNYGVTSPRRVAVGESPSPGNAVCCSALVRCWQTPAVSYRGAMSAAGRLATNPDAHQSAVVLGAVKD